ncbi:hypothetical protein F5Y16DRAFT_255493 [Xylariaceae sp. FL0255]|nr:hypothetical protein F5Y16DRAFT_255493 [Xylariaceae sp. FL0255]
MKSVLERLYKAARKTQNVPHENPPPYDLPKLLDDSPPPYERKDPYPICTSRRLWHIAYRASMTAGVESTKVKYSQQPVMLGIMDAIEVAMKESFERIEKCGIPFDSVKWALLIAAMTASLAAVRGNVLTSYLSGNASGKDYDIAKDCQDGAVNAGIDAGRAALLSASQLDIKSILDSEKIVILRRVSFKAAGRAGKGFPIESDRRRAVIGIVDTLDTAIHEGINSGTPFNNSAAVFTAAFNAAFIAIRSWISSLPQTQNEL